MKLLVELSIKCLIPLRLSKQAFVVSRQLRTLYNHSPVILMVPLEVLLAVEASAQDPQ